MAQQQLVQQAAEEKKAKVDYLDSFNICFQNMDQASWNLKLHQNDFADTVEKLRDEEAACEDQLRWTAPQINWVKKMEQNQRRIR